MDLITQKLRQLGFALKPVDLQRLKQEEKLKEEHKKKRGDDEDSEPLTDF
jgi:hypothetical protein